MRRRRRRGGGGGKGRQCSLFPSEMRSWGLLPASRALKVKRKNGRSQRPKKNDILLVTTPPARTFVVGASAFNWKQVQAPPVFLQCPTHTHARTCMHMHTRVPYIRVHTHSNIISPPLKAWWQLVKPDATCKAVLSAGSLSSPVSRDTRWPGGGALPWMTGGKPEEGQPASQIK